MLPKLEISEEEGFSKNDIFERKAFANGITKLLLETEQPIVAALHGEWGSGKTTFLKMWMGELKKEEVSCIYIDAFANDYIEDPFLVIASSIVEFVEDSKLDDEKTLENIKEKLVSVGKFVAGSALKIAAHVAVGNAADSLGEAAKGAFEKNADDAIGKYIDSKISNAKEERKSIQQLKASLSETAKKTKKERIIVIIDELDRCKPSFALAFLERIKHFFYAENVHFLISINKGQLNKFVEIEYSPSIDSINYLQKFFDLYFYLTLRKDKNAGDVKKFTSKFRDYIYKIANCNHENVKLTINYISDLADMKNFSLRETEKMLNQFVVALRAIQKNTIYDAPIIGGLCAAKAILPDIFNKAKAGNLTYSDIEPLIMVEGNQWYKEFWQFYLDPECPIEIKERFQSARWSFNQPEDWIGLVARTIIEPYSP